MKYPIDLRVKVFDRVAMLFLDLAAGYTSMFNWQKFKVCYTIRNAFLYVAF